MAPGQAEVRLLGPWQHWWRSQGRCGGSGSPPEHPQGPDSYPGIVCFSRSYSPKRSQNHLGHSSYVIVRFTCSSGHMILLSLHTNASVQLSLNIFLPYTQRIYIPEQYVFHIILCSQIILLSMVAA